MTLSMCLSDSGSGPKRCSWMKGNTDLCSQGCKDREEWAHFVFIKSLHESDYATFYHNDNVFFQFQYCMHFCLNLYIKIQQQNINIKLNG